MFSEQLKNFLNWTKLSPRAIPTSVRIFEQCPASPYDVWYVCRFHAVCDHWDRQQCRSHCVCHHRHCVHVVWWTLLSRVHGRCPALLYSRWTGQYCVLVSLVSMQYFSSVIIRILFSLDWPTLYSPGLVSVLFVFLLDWSVAELVNTAFWLDCQYHVLTGLVSNVFSRVCCWTGQYCILTSLVNTICLLDWSVLCPLHRYNKKSTQIKFYLITTILVYTYAHNMSSCDPKTLAVPSYGKLKVVHGIFKCLYRQYKQL